MKVRFIGLGNVGAKLASSLIRHRLDVTVRNISDEAALPLLEKGAGWSASGKALAEGSDMIIICPPSPEVSARVMKEPGGVLEGLSGGET